MSAQMKRTGIKGVTILAVTVFVSLMFFNIVFAPSAVATIKCDYRCYWNGLYAGCFDPTIVKNCLGCEGTTCN